MSGIKVVGRKTQIGDYVVLTSNGTPGWASSVPAQFALVKVIAIKDAKGMFGGELYKDAAKKAVSDDGRITAECCWSESEFGSFPDDAMSGPGWYIHKDGAFVDLWRDVGSILGYPPRLPKKLSKQDIKISGIQHCKKHLHIYYNRDGGCYKCLNNYPKTVIKKPKPLERPWNGW